MDAGTLDRGTVALVNARNSLAVTADIRCDDTCRTLTIDPIGKLAKATTYVVAIEDGTGGAKDLAGNPLDCGNGKCTWSFKTKRR